jgi:FtsH-binding integral membrane protein
MQAQPGYGYQQKGGMAPAVAIPVAQPMYAQPGAAVAQPMPRYGGGTTAPMAPPAHRQRPTSGAGGFLNANTDILIRHGFVRKVFGILLVQLLVTFGIIFYLNSALENECVRPGRGPSSTCKQIYYGGWAVGFGTMIAIFCCKSNAKIFPRNYILLAICTVAEALMLGAISSFYNTQSVFIAAGLTLVVAVALIIFASQTKHDFTGSPTTLQVVLVPPSSRTTS